MPRQPRLDAPGALHHVMVRGVNRGSIFEDGEDRSKFLDKLTATTLSAKAVIYAFALMDNHAHILIRSGDKGLSFIMRKTLTWYAIYFNRRHKRTGHLFENRYKSILCEEDPYLLTLVRYLHLNPIRVGLATDIHALDRYPWSGHRLLVGKDSPPWMGKDFILSQFGETRRKAVSAYRRFIEEGLTAPSHPTAGGWSQVVSMRRRQPEKGDERILGSSQFVLTVLAETEEMQKRQIRVSPVEIDGIIQEECAKEGVGEIELKRGSRRTKVSSARTRIAYRAVTELGLSLAEAARRLGVTTSSVSRAIERVERGMKGGNAM